MSYRELLKLEGSCSVVLGLEMAVVGAPGLFDSYPLWHGLVVLAIALVVLAALGRFRAPARWFTERPLATVRPGEPALEAGPLRRRLLIETALWIVLVTAWVVVRGESGALILGTGLASAVYGLVQLGPARARVARAEAQSGEPLLVTRRPGLGTPSLTTHCPI